MYYWRITKYNPKYRDNNGRYMHDEWTSIYDIGKCFNGKELTRVEYLSVETSYVNSILLIMIELNLKHMTITGLEKKGNTFFTNISDKFTQRFYDSIHDKMNVSFDDIGLFIKLTLRENIWGKLVSDHLEIHFGYDYYMYVCSTNNLESVNKIVKIKELFIEEFKSPHIEYD